MVEEFIASLNDAVMVVAPVASCIGLVELLTVGATVSMGLLRLFEESHPAMVASSNITGHAAE
jgi:hypothetical protein